MVGKCLGGQITGFLRPLVHIVNESLGAQCVSSSLAAKVKAKMNGVCSFHLEQFASGEACNAALKVR